MAMSLNTLNIERALAGLVFSFGKKSPGVKTLSPLCGVVFAIMLVVMA
jgi:hypothetical protein